MKRLLIVATACLALASCAGIPDHGPVTKVGAASGTGESTVRYSPAGPVKDASPHDVVRGYLDAMLAYPMTSGTAALFLTPEAAGKWQSSAGVGIYVQPEILTQSNVNHGGDPGNSATLVRLAIHEEATLDRQGNYLPTDVQQAFDFQLVRVRGQWRISNPQPGFLINRKFFDDYYRPFDAYFFDKSGKRLMADPVYVLVGDQLSTALMSSLLMGPTRRDEAIARTYIPPKTQLRTSVPLRTDGVAEVQFRDDLAGIPESSRDRVAAQVAWTLRQVAQVSRVRITGGENPLLPGGNGTQSVDSWQEFGPRFGNGTFFGAQHQRVVRVVGRAVDDVDGPWKTNTRDLSDLAVKAGEVAAVSADRKSLIVGAVAKKGTSTVRGSAFLRPSIDDAGRVWAIDTAHGHSRARLVEGKSVHTVKLGVVGQQHIRSFALSPDMTRYAVIAGSASQPRVYVGAILRDGDDRPTSLGRPTSLLAVSNAVTHVRSISWATSTSVTFLADESVVGTQVFEARIDGSMIVGGTARSGALLPDMEAVSLVTTGGDDPVRYVSDNAGNVWMLRTGETWERLPAGKFTALAASVD